jgi:hypothetical protein
MPVQSMRDLFVDKVALEHVSLRLRRFYLVCIIPTTHFLQEGQAVEFWDPKSNAFTETREHSIEKIFHSFYVFILRVNACQPLRWVRL